MQPASTQAPITPRNVDFELADHVTYDWHGAGPGVSNMFNAGSLTFPEGEQFFVDAARDCLPLCTDEALRKQVRAFMTQEAIHSREHRVYNEMLKKSGIKTGLINARIRFGRKWANRYVPAKWRLAMTVSSEHWTAILASHVLKNRTELLTGAEPVMQAIWLWHAVEETEHKAVCFDLLKSVCRTPLGFYALRCITHAVNGVSFLAGAHFLYFRLSQQTGNGRNWKAHRQMLSFHWGKVGAFRKLVPAYLAFFKPGFHPWDDDNRAYVAQWDKAAPDLTHPPHNLLAAGFGAAD